MIAQLAEFTSDGLSNTAEYTAFNELVTDLSLSPAAEERTEGANKCQTSQDVEVPEINRLLSLPVEVREQIYHYVFHTGPKRRIACVIHRFGLENIGCQCGNGVSLTNRQLYNETRSLFYRVGEFIFDSPRRCKRFLQSIDPYADDVTSLDISYQDTYPESIILREIFDMFTSSSRLYSLRLKAIPLSLGVVSDSPPIYFPTFQVGFPASFYDLSYRPVTHPLANMFSIRTLTVVGYPGSDGVDEALLKLRLTLEDLANKENKVKRFIERGHTWISDWKYILEITDETS